MAAAEQDVEQHAERVDVGRGGDLAARELLGGRVLRRERRAAVARERARFPAARPPWRIALDQLGDAEVEELDAPLLADEDVRRLDVAMDDQTGVGVGDGIEHVEEQAQPPLDGDRGALAVPIDRLPVDVLEHEVGLAGLRDAGVDEMGDVRMAKPRRGWCLRA